MNIIEHIAELTARRKLLPFLGAGCSKAILHCDWDSIIRDMAASLVDLSTDRRDAALDHLKVAQEYVDQYGKEGLCRFLEPYFQLQQFDEEKGCCHTAVMCSGAHVIYTTNQDNVMELCFRHFGRKFQAVTTVQDLVEAYPDECLYIKFHGDLSVPKSVVFTEKDYKERMTRADNFLDIRLRADLLGRSLLFLGYSFRDPDVQQLFGELQKIAGGHLPPSYLIAYSSNDEFVCKCERYGIQVIVPVELFPELTEQQAFERFLAEWNRLTYEKVMVGDIQSMFSPKRERCTRILAPMECMLLEQVLPELPLTEAIAKFRGIVDTANLPASLQPRVAEVFFELCRRCESREDAEMLNSASFNLYLTEKRLRYEQAVHVLALANVYQDERHALYFIQMPDGFPREQGVFVGACSIELLRKWNRPISEFFQYTLSHMADASLQYDTKGEAVAKFCMQQYDYAWQSHRTTLEHPLKRQKRINAPLRSFVSEDYRTIRDRMLRNMPTEIK